jgi:hypothetical protein
MGDGAVQAARGQGETGTACDDVGQQAAGGLLVEMGAGEQGEIEVRADQVEALHEAGARIPADVSLIGFDDAEWATLTRPGVSVVSQPVRELGRLAAQTLIDRIEGDTARPHSHVVPTRYVERASSGPAPARIRRLTLPGA